MEYKIDDEIIELIDDLFEFYKEEDWLIVKKFLVRYLKPEIRTKFSTRNQKTKKHTLNKFENIIITYCKENYNKNLKLKEEDKHYD